MKKNIYIDHYDNITCECGNNEFTVSMYIPSSADLRNHNSFKIVHCTKCNKKYELVNHQFDYSTAKEEFISEDENNIYIRLVQGT